MWPGASTWRRLRRLGARRAFLLVVAGALLASPLLLASEARWKPERLPAALRQRVHVEARSVPAYPMDDRRLEKPKTWPRVMTIGGVKCALRVHAWDEDDAIALTRLEDAEPEMRIMLFYDVSSSHPLSASAGWGPRYLWNERGKLIQRIWYEPDSSRLVTHDYTYYQDGRLLGYSRRSEPRRQPLLTGRSYSFLSEFFDRRGRLMAFAYEDMKPRSRDSLYAWMGEVVTYDQFRMKTHVLYSSAHPGER